MGGGASLFRSSRNREKFNKSDFNNHVKKMKDQRQQERRMRKQNQRQQEEELMTKKLKMA